MAQCSEDPPGLLKHLSSSLNQFILKCVCVLVCGVHGSARAPSWLLWVVRGGCMCGLKLLCSWHCRVPQMYLQWLVNPSETC